MKNLKRLGLLLLAMMLISALSITVFAVDASPAQEPVCYNHGDMNSDGIVDNRDAIYTLYCFMLGEDFGYAANQDWDFDANGSKDNKDALYVLYAYMLDGIVDTYQLKGIVHEYYDPAWEWNTSGADVTASVTFKCGCGQAHTVTSDDTDGVTVTAGTVTTATCVTAGSAEYEAKVTFDGVEYTASTTVTIPAAGYHDMSDPFGCEASVCLVCGYEQPAAGHSWVLDAEMSIEATCTAQAVQVYVCSSCGQTNQVELEGTVACQYEYIGDVNTTGCTYVKQYQCKSCNTVVNGAAASDTYEMHSYTAALTKEATCVSAGEKTYTCGVCGSSYTEEVAANGSHNWVEDGTVNGVTSYHCGSEGCGETKTVVSSASNEAALDSKDALDGNELQLGNGTMLELDEDAVNGLESDKQLIISVDEIDADDTNLPDELRAQVGNNVVYDFTMAYTDGQNLTPVTSFEGKITVSLPYQLVEGEDIDSIDVWFINDEGEAEQVFGTYSNGYVTFTTEHFSYYSVTRLLPAQRCERYGHLIVDANKQATCTADGYSMSVCQRCGEQLSKTVISMTGHSYEETVVAATCTTDGSSKKVCSDCGHTVTAVLPTLGHSMELDASQSVAATCGTAGKNVYNCANCDHTTENELAQLKHQYVLDHSQTADCTGKGFDVYVCSLCGDEDVRNEKAPLGHNYKVSQWIWSADKLSATLELVCSNDAGHTHSINAVVTSKASGSVCEGQSITYTAAASYNNITYTGTAAGIGEAAGHTPGNIWITNANQHYHECTVCGEKIDSAKHTWDEGTVTVEPTCSAAGSALYTCTVCGFEKTAAVPATREHNYVDGVCTVCGMTEDGGCSHEMEEVGTLDLSTVGGCEGVFVLYSCGCGKNTYVEPDEWTCEIGDITETEETLSDGTVVFRQTGICTVCGLTVEVGGYQMEDADACTYYYVQWIDLYMDGELIVDTEFTSEEYDHPTVLTETVELTKDEHGICDMVIEIYTCYCGERIDIDEDSACEWYWTDYTEDGTLYTCRLCGALRTVVWGREDAGQCEVAETRAVTFYTSDGEEIYSYTERYIYEEHAYDVVSYEMMGESCEDGVYVTLACDDCGELREYFTDNHEYVVYETTDLSGTGTCAQAITQYSCACGLTMGSYMECDDGDGCHWVYRGYDEEIEAEVLECETCGGFQYISYQQSEKDEHCRIFYSTTETYTDADGNVIAVGYGQDFETAHDYEYEAILEGESCEDGVTVYGTCADCGCSYEDYYGHHYEMTQEYYDLSEYGMCGGYIESYACACGENTGIYRNEYCEWDYAGYDGNAEYLVCVNCDAELCVQWASVGSDELCQEITEITYTYSMDGEELLSVSFVDVYANHDYIYEMTLDEGANSCSDGFSYVATCQTCGDTYTGRDYYHWNRVLSREDIPEGVFCGSAQLVTEGCACGRERYTYIEWTSDTACEYDWFWDDENGVEYRVCTNCGIRRDHKYTEALGDDPCEVHYIDEYTFSRDGEVLFTYVNSQRGQRHRVVYTFEMDGESCADGYYVYASCMDCDYTDYWHTDGHHDYAISREAVPEGIFCGEPELITYSCPCGQITGKELYWKIGSCEFTWWGDDTVEYFECQECGVTGEIRYEAVLAEGTCIYEVTRYYTYYKDDVEVYSYTSSYFTERHSYVYSYDLWGETCADGYTVTCTCSECGESETWEDSYHSSNVVAREPVAEGILCGPAEIVTESCACGYYSDTYLEWTGDESCYWEEVYDDQLGEWICSCVNCGIVRDYTYSETREEGICRVYENYEYTYSLNGEVLLSFVDREWFRSHKNVWTFELNGESCEDGYSATYVCTVCGDSDTYSYSGGYHEDYVIAREDIEDGIFCGDAELLTKSCACGYYTFSTIYTGCDWGWIYDDDLDCYVGTCKSCGLIWAEEYTEVPEEGTCKVMKYTTNTFTRDGEVVYTFTAYDVNWEHSYIYTYDLWGETCEDGYTYTCTCTVCGESSTGEDVGHWTRAISCEPVPEGILCGEAEVVIERCACGHQGGAYIEWLGDENCNWSWTGYEDNSKTDCYECTNCGIVSKFRRSYTTENCKRTYVYTYSYYRDGEEVYSYSYDRVYDSHGYVYTIEMYGDSCSDGYLVTEYCAYCDLPSKTYEYYGCSTWTISRQEITGLCGKTELVQKGCGCGYFDNCELQWFSSEQCDWTYNWREDLGEWVYQCANCGVRRTVTSQTVEGDAACEVLSIHDVNYIRDGEVIASGTYKSRNWDHNHVYSYELSGESCSDGYSYTAICQTCGYCYTGTSYYHNENAVSREALPEGVFCDSGELVIRSCACGQWQGAYIDWDNDGCNFDWDYDLGAHVCVDCGMVYQEETVYRYDAANCREYYDRSIVYTLNGEVVLSYSYTEWETEHNYLATFELLGETCDDGYTVTYTCHCGDTYSNDVQYGCSTSVAERIYLSEYGMCGGSLTVSSCACGAEQYIYWNSYCDYEWVEDTGDGLDQRYCADCNTYIASATKSDYVKESCAIMGNWYFRLIRDGETLLDRTGVYSSASHDYEVSGAELLGESCEDGVEVTFACTVCGKSYTDTKYYHYSYLVDEIDLAELGACDGSLRIYGCACGENSYIYGNYDCYLSYVSTWEETDDSGVVTTYTLYRCGTCGLEKLRSVYTLYPEDSCHGERHSCESYIFGDTVLEEDSWVSSVEEHNYVYSYALKEGAAVCSDGVVETYTCSDCGNSGSYTRYYSCSSNMIERERIDLSAYGSVCGGYLAHSTCVCGQREDYSLVDMECDLDRNYSAIWLDDFIRSGIHTTEGWVYYGNSCYVYTCAVTDPACAMKMRFAYYWVAEGCEAVEYKVWQLGYDEETDTCLREITYTTGNRRTYHAYAYTAAEETLADGTTVNRYSYVCPDCGSSYLEEDHYSADGPRIKYVMEATNTLDNGESKYRLELHEYVEYREGCYDYSLSRYERVYADGSEYWQQYVYTYDNICCKKIASYTDSNGNEDVYEDTYHSNSWYYETLKESTCTQYGEYHEYAECRYCGETTYDATYSDSPDGHYWSWDSTKQIYYCSVCGLENANGADGTIVLEDLTTDDGNDYVVGYWNKGNVIFTTYVSVVVLQDGEELDELVLSGIELSELTAEADGITAFAVNKDTVCEAAAAAMTENYYIGSYAIRISFVPANSDTTLDYSITFDSISAE